MGDKPAWAPSWAPAGESVKYVQSVLQVVLLLLGGSWVLMHLWRGGWRPAARAAAGGA